VLAMVVNDDAFILERTRRLQVHRQQAGSYKREPLASSDLIYQANRYRVVVLDVSK
jgi:hypothetical protein